MKENEDRHGSQKSLGDRELEGQEMFSEIGLNLVYFLFRLS